MKKTVLVTGGAGFIGSHIVDSLVEQGEYRIVILDDLSTGSLDNIRQHGPAVEMIEGKAQDPAVLDRLFSKFRFDIIFHQAAVASVQASVEDPVRTHAINCDATLYLLERAKQQNTLSRFLYAGSSAVYGEQKKFPLSEEAPTRPIAPYGIDKLASEKYVIAYNKLYGLPGVVFRYFNVYGPRQNPSSPYSGVLSIFTDAFLKSDKPEITIYGDGGQTRDFIHVHDVVRANMLCMTSEKAAGNVFNVGTGSAVPLLQIVKAMESSFGKKAAVRHQPAREGDIRRSVADIGAIKGIGFRPRFGIAKGLEQYVIALSAAAGRKS